METVALFLAMNRRMRSSKEPSINKQPFHISCSYLEWAGKKNADKKRTESSHVTVLMTLLRSISVEQSGYKPDYKDCSVNGK